MTTINLKRYYPYMTENVILEVSDEIAAALSMGGRLCDSYKRQKRRNGECSLDTDPGFEADVLHQPLTPDEYIEARETTFALYDALAQLPPTQARRVYQHYLLGMSKAEIAALSAETMSPEQIERLSVYLNQWEEIDFEDRRQVADGLISQIRATDEHVSIEWKI